MPQARNQAVTVRRPRANKAPPKSCSKRGAERGSRTLAKQENQRDTVAGKCDNTTAGSLARDRIFHYPYPVRGAGNCPRHHHGHCSITSKSKTSPVGKKHRISRKVQLTWSPV